MARARIVHKSDGVALHGWRIDCPGCGWPHVLDQRWTFNGDFERPTFRASLLVTQQGPERDAIHVSLPPGRRCHSFITDGRIQFLDDCTHALKGQTVDLPELSP